MSNGFFVGLVAATGVGLALAMFSSAYVVNEGRVAVITDMGQAVRQEPPSGLQFKIPFIMGVREFDVRERSLPITINAATSNQLNTNMDVTFNLRPDPGQVLDIYVKYGDPEAFLANIVRPRLAQSAKSTVGRFSSVQLTREREALAEAMMADSIETLEGYPVIVSSAQIENFSLPQRYWDAILDKEEQREKTAKESLLLEQQNIKAQQAVQTAAADRDALKARADGEAYATRVQAEAEAESIRLRSVAEAEGVKEIQEALASNPWIVEYERNKRWDGVLPSIVMGEQPELLMQMPEVDER